MRSAPHGKMMITRHSVVWLLASLLLASPLHAQRQKPSTGPRAIGVLEWTSQGLRLVPVSLMLDGRFYDATLYRANPVPLAVEQDTVYQVQKSGDPLGDFTITTPAQLPNGGWIGQGSYESDADRKKKAEERAKAAAAAAAAATKPVNPEEERPVLRHGSSKTEAPAPSTSTPPDTASPTSTPAAGTAPTATQSSPPPATPPLTNTDSDPNRPILKRGKPREEQAQKLGKEDLPHKAPPKKPAGIERIQVAVSDAGPNESHPYVWKWSNPDEEKKFRADAEKMALSLINDYAKKNGGPTPGKVDVTGFNAFDLAYNNEPDVVFTARVFPAPTTAAKKAGGKVATPPPAPAPNGFEYYITLVAREDIYGQMQKSFAQVTDNKHLDAFPKFELIDAVDADGDHNGELLFRRISDISSSFVIYRVTGYQVEELLRVPEPREMDTGF